MIQEIERHVRQVRRRLRWLRFCRMALWGVSLATGLAALVFLAGKLHPLPFEARYAWTLWAGLVGAGLLWSAGYALFSRLTLLDAALAADLRLGLRERLSSAIALRDREADSPAVAALLEDAARAARRLRPSQDFPFLLSSRAIHHLWPAAALLAIHFLMPQWHLFQSASARQKMEQARVDSATVQKQAERIEKMAEKIKGATGSENDDLLKYSKELEKIARDLKSGDKEPRQAMAEMSRVSEELRVDRQDLAKKFEAFQKAAPPAQSNFTREMSRSMQNGNFEKAAEQMKQMAESMMKQGDSTSAAEKEQMAQDMQKMAEQLASTSPEMSEAMKKAAEAMQQAAQAQEKGQSAAMQQALAQAEQALQQAAQQMSEQAEAAQEMRQLDQLQESLEQQKREMAQACGMSGSRQGAQGEGGSEGEGEEGEGQGEGRRPGGSGRTGEWAEGVREGEGSGMGGPGRGRGGEAQYDDSSNPQFEDVRPPGVANAGEIIAVMNVDGPAAKGESKAQYQEVFSEYRQKADDAMQQEVIPAGYRNHVRAYFDAISPETFGKEKGAGTPTSSSAAPARP